MKKVLLCLPVVLGLALASFHLNDELWHDEIVTLIHFADGDVLTALTDYHVPNNHIVFSALLSIWISVFDLVQSDVMVLRILPLLIFAGTILVTTRCGGVLAGLIVATSHIALNFSCQLRGYGLGMMLAAFMLLGWIGLMRGGSKKSFWIYVGASACALGVMPTNIYLHFVLGGAFVWCRWKRDPKICLRLVFIPALGALFYVGVLDDFSEFMREGKHYNYHLTVTGILSEWSLGILRDFWPLLLFVIPGLRKIWTERSEHHWKILLLVLFVMVPLFLWAMPSKPVTRTLIPLIPIFAVLAARMVGDLKDSKILTTVIIIMCAYAGLREQDPDRWVPEYAGMNHDSNFDSGYDNILGVYSLYYHNEFSPKTAYQAIQRLSADQMTMTFFDSSDPIALRHLADTNRFHWNKDQMFAYHYQYVVDIDELPWRLKGVPVLFVTARSEGVDEMARHLKLPLESPDLEFPYEDHGFYKIYRYFPYP